ncbi:hypothetical protein SAMN02927900_01136 [Rhizobium mongolense subsp. loessense]|uniref:Uncharacterized protein n=1 Tax=Rhizobium mongolense subsp. loessense TaxID=158890 RepID=A0A1G4PZA2_9HYPH|nr:hypothetical protein SAMN02927900_01136 [Rhizobium mongolense subsp. loessense]
MPVHTNTVPQIETDAESRGGYRLHAASVMLAAPSRLPDLVFRPACPNANFTVPIPFSSHEHGAAERTKHLRSVTSHGPGANSSSA